jgi:hypothetical protein
VGYRGGKGGDIEFRWRTKGRGVTLFSANG